MSSSLSDDGEARLPPLLFGGTRRQLVPVYYLVLHVTFFERTCRRERGLSNFEKERERENWKVMSGLWEENSPPPSFYTSCLDLCRVFH